MTNINYIERLDVINRPEPTQPTYDDVKVPMGRSTPAIILACIAAVFIFPIALLFGITSNVVFVPDVGLDSDGMTMGWGMFGFVHGLLIAVVAAMAFNRMRNYATNIMGISFVLGYTFGLLFLSVASKF